MVLKPMVKIVLLAGSCILYLLTILAAYGGRFDTDFFTIPALLTLTLPYLAVATLLVAVGWLACRKLLPGALGVLAIICSWGPVSTASPLALSKSAPAGAVKFTLMTWNVIHGIDQQAAGEQKGNRTFQYILKSDADIVCLQELRGFNDSEVPNLTPAFLDSLKRKYPYIVGSEKYDTKLLSRYPARYVDGAEYIDGNYDRRRYTFYRINIEGRELTVVNLHLMSYRLSEEERNVVTSMRSVGGVKESINEMRGSILDKMHAGFKKRKADAEILRSALEKIQGPLIVCGDFNDVPESYAYRIIRSAHLRDAYAETGFGPLVTYNRHAFWFHLDQVLYRGPLRALSVEKGSIKSSDHYPLIAEFCFERQK